MEYYIDFFIIITEGWVFQPTFLTQGTHSLAEGHWNLVHGHQTSLGINLFLFCKIAKSMVVSSLMGWA